MNKGITSDLLNARGRFVANADNTQLKTLCMRIVLNSLDSQLELMPFKFDCRVPTGRSVFENILESNKPSVSL